MERASAGRGTAADDRRPRARSLDDHELAALVEQTVPEVRDGRWRVVAVTTTAARKQRGKQIVDVTVTYEDPSRSAGRRTVRLVVKLYGSDRGAPALEALRVLRGAGFRPPAPSRVPRPHGYAPAQGALLQEHVTGQPWADLLTAPDAARDAGARSAAQWLVALQRSAVAGPSLPADLSARQVQAWTGALAADFPAAASRLRELAARVVPSLTTGAAPLPAHGDYHPKNVFLDDAGAVVIDFDTFGHREPAFDVGYAVGQLLVMSSFRCGDLGPGVAAASAFWRHYAAAGGAASEERVRLQVVRTLVQSLHYELCTLGNGRLHLLERWPALAEAVLTDRLVLSDGLSAAAGP